MIFPPQKIYTETVRKVEEAGRKIAKALKITGPFNIQFIAKDNEVMVIECNARASRSFPFVSKVMKVNFIECAVRAMVGESVEKTGMEFLLLPYVGVKSPQFSFARLTGADPVLGVEMASTGEVACFGDTLHEAFLKSVLSSGYSLPKSSVLISVGGDKQKFDFLDEARLLQELGFTIYATEHTSAFLSLHGIANTMIFKAHDKDKANNVEKYMEQRKLDLVISVPNPEEATFSMDHHVIRRKAVDLAIPLFMNLQVAKLFVQSIARFKKEDLEIKSWEEYNV